MIGVVALLERETIGADAPAVPHLTFHRAAAYEWEFVIGALDALAKDTPPIDIIADDVAIFDTVPAVVYLNIADPQPLRALQARIYERIDPNAFDADPFYAPQAWTPRVTLASGVDAGAAAKLAQSLRSRKIQWKIRLDNLAYLSVENGEYSVSGRVLLTGA